MNRQHVTSALDVLSTASGCLAAFLTDLRLGLAAVCVGGLVFSWRLTR